MAWPVAEVHGYAVVPVGVGVVVDAAVCGEDGVAGDVVGGDVAAGPFGGPDEDVDVGLGEHAGGDEFEEFEAAVGVVGGV
nr:MAG: hypothetical protein [Bacteriophage sp.]